MHPTGLVSAILMREPGNLQGPPTPESDHLLPIRELEYEQSSNLYHLGSPSLLDAVVDTLIEVLQTFNFRKDFNLHWGEDFKAFRTVFNEHALLCEVSECKLPPDSRPLQRQAMFIAWVKRRSKDLELGLKPIVMKRYRREGGDFTYDDKGSVIGTPLCDSVAKKVIAKHTAPKSQQRHA